MSGDQKNPGKITIIWDKLQAEGAVAGLTVAQVRELLLRDVKEFAALPPDARARIVTMDPQDEAWKQVTTEESERIMTRVTSGRVQMFQAVSKSVPDSYVIRKADICLEFSART